MRPIRIPRATTNITRPCAFSPRTTATSSRRSAKQILHGLAFRESDFERPAQRLERRLDHARASRAVACSGARSPPARRADESSRSRIARLVSGASAAISRRDPHDLARPRVSQSARRFHCRDFAATSQSATAAIGTITYREKAAREEQQLAAYKNQQREIAALQEFADRFRAKASKASQAQSKLKQIERMEKIEAPQAAERSVGKFRFPQPPRSGQRVHHLTDIDFAYGETHRLSRTEFRSRARPAHRARRPEWRGQIDPAQARSPACSSRRAARAISGHNVKVGYFAQHRVEMLNATSQRPRERCWTRPIPWRTDRAHGSRLVPFPRRRCLQARRAS